MILDLSGQGLEVLVIGVEASKSVLSPVVAEVGLYLCCQRLWKRLIVRESRKQYQPVVKVTAFVDHAHFLFVIANDLDEVSHNVGEERNTTKHNDNSYDPLVVADWVVVTISNSTERCKSIVATNNQLMSLVLLIELVLLDEGVRLCVVVNGAEHEPDATDEVSDDDGNDDQTEDLVDIEHHVLSHDLFVSGLVAHE